MYIGLGAERHGPKSHVLTDWITSCLTQHSITSLTSGTEARQFLHAEDCASALVTMMENFSVLESVTDLSSNVWTTMRTIAAVISDTAPRNISCPATFSQTKAIARARLSPKTNVPFYQLWQPQISLEEGLHRLFEHYDTELQQISQGYTPSTVSPSASTASVESDSSLDKNQMVTATVELPSNDVDVTLATLTSTS